jgi:hypothetical protein
MSRPFTHELKEKWETDNGKRGILYILYEMPVLF